MSSLQATTWIIASIFYAYQYILRVMPNIMMQEILHQFHLDAYTFGLFSGVYYIGYSLMHIPIGLLMDYYGPKKVMPICMIMMVIGLLPILFSDFWLYPIIGRALIGIGSSAAILGVFKVVRLMFRPDQFSLMLSLSVTIGLMGAIYGGGPINYLCTTLGYKIVTGILALVGLILSTITYLTMPTLEQQPSKTVLTDLKNVIFQKKAMCICFLAGLMVGPLEGFADVWGTAFLKQVYGLQGISAASLPSLIFVGMCFGAPLMSWIAEKTKNYLGTIIGSGIIMALSFCALLTGMVNTTSMSTLFIIIGICCSYQIIAIYQASTYVPEKVVSLTTAIANMIIMIFGFIFHTIIGYLINTCGGPSSKAAFIIGIGVIPIALTLASLGFIILMLHEKMTGTLTR